jgi:hypothetical protein
VIRFGIFGESHGGALLSRNSLPDDDEVSSKFTSDLEAIRVDANYLRFFGYGTMFVKFHANVD